MRFWGGTLLVILAGSSNLVGSSQSAEAAPRLILQPGSAATLAPTPVVVFGRHSRRTTEEFAAEHRLDAAELRRSHAASGLIQCGDAHGAGQLTLSDNVITTAAHVFYDENGFPRSTSCTFDLTVADKLARIPIDLTSVVAGSNNPYAVEPAHDWAVARLTRRAEGVKPYGMSADIHPREPVTFVARGHIDWGEARRLSFEQCTLHDQLATATEGTREFSFDCETGDGASGGALMVDDDGSQIGGILVGWRSNRPFSAVPFSRTHYNFVVTLEGGFRKAVLATVANVTAQK